jgi:Tfp pilus assembly pilus retraction ATPase PilT
MSSPRYDMTDLLALIVSEGAERLSLHAGHPPVVHLRGESHTIEGPIITQENAETLLRSLANTRKVRELREHGTVDLIYSSRDSIQFRVQATICQDQFHLELQRLAVS